MKYERMPIEIESPEQLGYGNVKFNLTESSFTDARFDDLKLDLKGLVLCYGDHLGNPRLRALVAADAGVEPEDVLITAGAAPALFIVATSLLEKGDRILVEHPNYATNIVTPRAIGAKVDEIALRFKTGFRPDLDEIRRKLTPRTRYVSVTVPHNPTGALLTRAELDALIALVERKKTRLLVDETYREMAFERKLPVAASLSERAISVSSMSKTYGLPGIRVGWLICRDKKLMTTFLAAKEQIMLCGSVVDEEIAARYLAGRRARLPAIEREIRAKFAILKDWFERQNDLEWVEPSGGVVSFPRIKAGAGVDPDAFYRALNERFETFVGPGHWFETDRRHMRIGFGWPSRSELARGLENITKAFAACR